MVGLTLYMFRKAVIVKSCSIADTISFYSTQGEKKPSLHSQGTTPSAQKDGCTPRGVGRAPARRCHRKRPDCACDAAALAAAPVLSGGVAAVSAGAIARAFAASFRRRQLTLQIEARAPGSGSASGAGACCVQAEMKCGTQVLCEYCAVITQRLRSHYAQITQSLRKEYADITQTLRSYQTGITQNYAIALRMITQFITQLNYAIHYAIKLLN